MTGQRRQMSQRVAARGDARAPVIVGFAAETGSADASVLDLGRAKLARKGCDLLVVNDVSDGRVFGRRDNEAVILGRDGLERPVPLADKATVADAVWDAVVPLLP